jgi:hypothetical protein
MSNWIWAEEGTGISFEAYQYFVVPALAIPFVLAFTNVTAYKHL